MMDSTIARRVYERSRLADHPLILFLSGEDFLEYMDEVDTGKRSLPGLVFLDLHMMGIDGLEVLDRVRQNPAFGEGPCIFILTHDNDPAHERASFDHGADGFKVKPAEPEKLLEFFNSFQTR